METKLKKLFPVWKLTSFPYLICPERYLFTQKKYIIKSFCPFWFCGVILSTSQNYVLINLAKLTSFRNRISVYGLQYALNIQEAIGAVAIILWHIFKMVASQARNSTIHLNRDILNNIYWFDRINNDPSSWL